MDNFEREFILWLTKLMVFLCLEFLSPNIGHFVFRVRSRVTTMQLLSAARHVTVEKVKFFTTFLVSFLAAVYLSTMSEMVKIQNESYRLMTSGDWGIMALSEKQTMRRQ